MGLAGLSGENLRSRWISGAVFASAILVVSTLVNVSIVVRYCLTYDSFALGDSRPQGINAYPAHTLGNGY
ncbi:hypothetical protein BDV10DRAFT_87092 [Aspergillus recurvatus]